ncbi:MAG: hypothetical protein KC657_00375 [Myxococcales bacterium]|nr:hypothetical protein [Myxococcales bacterium]
MIGLVGVGAVGVAAALLYKPFPPDRTPEGAYMRIARTVADDTPALAFAYLETEAQWACFSVRDARAKAAARVAASYPEPQRAELLAQYERFARAPDGADVFAIYYRERGWSRRLRKDLSGIARVEIEADRASVVTARGSRYPFRRRDNGIWGLTIFTAELEAEADRARKDLGIVEAAADDYDKLAKQRP